MSEGRPRKPRAAKERDGTYRKDRDQQIDLPNGEPDKPPFLSFEAEEHWHRLVPLLAEHNLLTRVDGYALGMLCQALAEYQEADRDVQNDGLTGMTDKGYSYVNPGVAIRHNAWKKVCWALRQFGMTPSARAGMKVTSNGQDSDEFEQALKAAAASLTQSTQQSTSAQSGSKGNGSAASGRRKRGT